MTWLRLPAQALPMARHQASMKLLTCGNPRSQSKKQEVGLFRTSKMRLMWRAPGVAAKRCGEGGFRSQASHRLTRKSAQAYTPPATLMLRGSRTPGPGTNSRKHGQAHNVPPPVSSAAKSWAWQLCGRALPNSSDSKPHGSGLRQWHGRLATDACSLPAIASLSLPSGLCSRIALLVTPSSLARSAEKRHWEEEAHCTRAAAHHTLPECPVDINRTA